MEFVSLDSGQYEVNNGVVFVDLSNIFATQENLFYQNIKADSDFHLGKCRTGRKRSY